MTSKQKKKIVLAVTLLLLLALLVGYYLYYQSTHKLTLDIAPVDSAMVAPPEYLFAFSGSEGNRMQRPVGVLVDGDEVLVVDSLRHEIGVFNLDGDYQRSFGASQTVVPLYIAKNPSGGDYYVSDRRARSIHIFSPEGEYKGEFDPEIPKEELPEFDTRGTQWAPIALAFGDDGSLYVTEVLKGHRLLIFGPDGAFKKSVGTLGLVTDASQGPEVFQFPNGITVRDGLVYVADSNNRRIQVFDTEGTFQRFLPTAGLPRGVAFLNRFLDDAEDAPARLVVVDTLSHDGTLWTDDGNKILSFGQQGVLEGQFNYPTSVSVAAKNRMFITDTANGRVQVWGWVSESSPVPIPRLPQKWGYCLLPLLLLPLLLLLRKKKFFATSDFIHAMVENEEVHLLPARNRKWLVIPADYETLKDIKQGDVDLGELLHEIEHSESDARALMEKLEIAEAQAIVLSLAQRSRIFATQDAELRRLAKTLEVDVVNRVEFIERFTKQPDGNGPTADGPSGSSPVRSDGQ